MDYFREGDLPFPLSLVTMGGVCFTGPWLTFEIQLPQDDFHLLAWVLGEKLNTHDSEMEETRTTYNLRGLESEEKLLEGILFTPHTHTHTHTHTQAHDLCLVCCYTS